LQQLNRINVSIFTPALLFSKVAFFLSPGKSTFSLSVSVCGLTSIATDKLKELWIIPFFFAITTGVSMTVAYLLGTAFRLKRSQRSFAMAAAMFMNSNSLPIALMQSLVITVPGLKWGDDDTRSAMIGRALTYLVLHSTLGMVVSKFDNGTTVLGFKLTFIRSFVGVTEFVSWRKPTMR
jgi:predicted permease